MSVAGRADKPAPGAPLVVFDFDHTLYDGDSGGHLFRWLVMRAWWRRVLACPRAGAASARSCGSARSGSTGAATWTP